MTPVIPGDPEGLRFSQLSVQTSLLPSRPPHRALTYDVTALDGGRFDFAIREGVFLEPEPA